VRAADVRALVPLSPIKRTLVVDRMIVTRRFRSRVRVVEAAARTAAVVTGEEEDEQGGRAASQCAQPVGLGANAHPDGMLRHPHIYGSCGGSWLNGGTSSARNEPQDREDGRTPPGRGPSYVVPTRPGASARRWPSQARSWFERLGVARRAARFYLASTRAPRSWQAGRVRGRTPVTERRGTGLRRDAARDRGWGTEMVSAWARRRRAGRLLGRRDGAVEGDAGDGAWRGTRSGERSRRWAWCRARGAEALQELIGQAAGGWTRSTTGGAEAEAKNARGAVWAEAAGRRRAAARSW